MDIHEFRGSRLATTCCARIGSRINERVTAMRTPSLPWREAAAADVECCVTLLGVIATNSFGTRDANEPVPRCSRADAAAHTDPVAEPLSA